MIKRKFKRQQIIIAFCILIFLAAVAGSLVVLFAPHGHMVQIVQDGTVLYTLDLSKEEDKTIQVEFEGRINTIQILDGKIRMKEADCPDNTCVHMSWLDSTPIVCLPNHLVIQYADSIEDVDMSI